MQRVHLPDMRTAHSDQRSEANQGVGEAGCVWYNAEEGVYMSEAEAAGYVREYLSVKAAIGKLEKLAKGLRERVIEAIGPDGAEPGKVWTFDGIGTVTVVKGKAGDTYIDRTRLARAGVDPKVLDEATVTDPDGKPSMRINALEATTDVG